MSEAEDKNTTEVEEEVKEPPREPIDVTITDIELEELKDFKHKYLQLLADHQNARRRLQKEKQDIVQYAIQNVTLEFLDPIDHMENALGFAEQASDEVKNWAKGFEMIITQFRDVLTNQGVKPMETVGHVFDPNFHEAIEMVETIEAPEGTVVKEERRGYTIGERVLRPARVKVAKAPAAEKVSEEKENKETNNE